MASKKTEMENTPALSFANDVQYRTVRQCMPGADRFLSTGLIVDLPGNNIDATVDLLVEAGQLVHALKSELLKLAAGQVALGYDQRRKIDDTMITAGALFLDFATIDPVLTRYPKDDDDYEFYRSGIPLIPEEDVVLIPNSGLLFTTAWAASETGQLLVRSAGQRTGTQYRWYKGIKFDGAGNRTANFADIGKDLRGKVINPMPTSADQIFVYAGMLLVPTDDYTVTDSLGDPLPGNGIAQVNFQADIPDDKVCIFRIEAGV